MGNMSTLAGKQIIDAGDMSADITSESIDTRHIEMVGVTLVSTGSPNGEYQILASDDGVNFNAVTLDPNPFSITSAGTDTITIPRWPHAYMKVKFAFSSGTGSLDAYLTMKRT